MDKDASIQARWGVLREKLKKSPNVLGTEAGLGNGTAGKWTDRHLEKHTAQVEKFLKHYRIDPVWWRTGNGEPFLQTESHGRFIDAEVWEELRSSHKFIIGTAGMYQMEIDRLWGIINHFTSRDGGVDAKVIHKKLKQ